MLVDLALQKRNSSNRAYSVLVLALAHSPEDLARFHLGMDHQQRGSQLVSLPSLETRHILFHEQKYENQHSSIVPVREHIFSGR